MGPGGRRISRRRYVVPSVVAAAALAAAALVAVPGTASAATDSTDPVLVSAARSTASTVSGGQTVGVQVQASDAGGSHLSLVRVHFRAANGTEFEPVGGWSGQALDAVNEVVSGTTPVWLANGTYQAQYVEVSDGDGNTLRYNRDGRITKGISDVGPHAVTVSALDFSVNNPKSDAAPPRLSNVSLRSSTVKAGDPIVMTYTASDVGSGVESVQALYESPGAIPVWVRSPLETGYGPSGFASGVLPASLPGGSYQLGYVLVRDNAGNSTFYSPGSPDTVSTTPVGLVQPPAIDLSAAALTVSQPNPPDVTAPHLTNFFLYSSARHLGEQATFGFTVTDASPVAEVRIFLSDPDGRSKVAVKRCGPFAPGKVSFWFPPDVPQGRWDVTGVTVIDAADNIRTYAPSGAGEQTGQPTHNGPVFTNMHVDLTAGAIRPDPVAVPDSCVDPVVTTAVSPTYAPTGSYVRLSGRVTFGGAAVANPVLAVFRGRGAASRYVGLTTGTTTGAYSLPVPVTSSTGLRAYFLGSGRTGLAEAFGSTVSVWTGAVSKVVARDTSIRVPRGAKRTLSAYVAPRRAGVTVTLWRKSGSTWKRVAAERSSARGKVAHRISRPAKKAYYRWTTSYAGGYLPATSRTITVKR